MRLPKVESLAASRRHMAVRPAVTPSSRHSVDDAAGGRADQVQADGRQRAGLDRAELLEQLDRTGRARGRERIRVLLHLAPQLSAQRPRQALEPLVLPVVEALLEALPARSAGELGLAAGHVLEHVGDGLARAGFPHEEYREDAVGVQQRDPDARGLRRGRSEEHTSELQSLMRRSYAALCLKKK